MPAWQRHNPPDNTSRGHVGSQYHDEDDGSPELYNQSVHHGIRRGAYPHHSSQPNSYSTTYQPSQSPVNHGMRIRGAASTETDMRIRGAAGREQPPNAISPQPKPQVTFDPPHPDIPSDAWSRSSTRAHSSPTSEQPAFSFNSNPIDQKSVIQRKEEQIREQQKFINRLTCESHALAANVGTLTEANERLSRQLGDKDMELQHLEARNNKLLRQRDESMAGQTKQLKQSNRYVEDLLAQVRKLGELPVPPPGDDFWPSLSAEALQNRKAAGDGMTAGDDLNALDFPDHLDLQAADWITPVERRAQPLGNTMIESDLIESQQHVIVSKYLRNAEDSEKGSWSRPVEQSDYWPRVKDDPAFALRVGAGSTVTFEMLHERLQDIASTHNIYGETQYQTHWPPVNNRNEQEGPQTQNPIERRLSDEQETRLAALGVSGDPKPVRPYVPSKARGRSRSRSPENEGQQDQSKDYRHRGYATHRPERQSTEDSGDSSLAVYDVVPLDTAMDPETARNIEAKFGNGQQRQNKRKGNKGKGKNKQNQRHNQQNNQQQTRFQHEQLAQRQPSNSANSRPGSGRFQGRHDQRRNGTVYR